MNTYGVDQQYTIFE